MSIICTKRIFLEDMMKGEKIDNNSNVYLNLFGEFKFTYDGKTLTKKDLPRMVSAFAIYLFANYKDSISYESIYEAVWGGRIQNPESSIKNMMYRFRKILDSKWPEQKFWLTGKGCYYWNSEIKVCSDIEIINSKISALEKSYYKKMGGVATDLKERKKLLESTLKQYNGKFLKDFSEYHWVLFQQMYYHNRIVRFFSEYCEILEHREDLSDMEYICKKILKIDELSEEAHYWGIKNLILQERWKEAETHFLKAVQLLYDGNPRLVSDKLLEQNEIISNSFKNKARDYSVDEIYRELTMPLEDKAFNCGIVVFRQIFTSLNRQIKRYGREATLLVIDISYSESESNTRGTEKDFVIAEKLIRGSLRASDVMTKVHNDRFVIILIDCSLKNSEIVIKRISSALKKDLKIQIKVQSKKMSGE